MSLETLIASALEQGASDLHLEPGLPATVRVRGSLRSLSDPCSAPILAEWARDLIGAEGWQLFLERRSFDCSQTIAGVRCRINVLQSSRGIGFAVRLLASFEATLERLNLHPDLRRLVSHTHGLILVSGPTGSGKSSTLAALIQEINLTEARHVVTIESPIEYTFRPHRALIRQREVGRDTPSFEQALLDSLREDPDVLMVGEMREPETMRLTLNASETGHLVLATVHSSTCAEALQRIVAAFPSEIQGSVAAQLADCLVGVISQRLRFREALQIRVPECEILIPTHPIKAFIRNRDFFKMMSVLETGAEHGMWTFDRYRTWLDRRKNWFVPGTEAPLDGGQELSRPPAATPGPPAAGNVIGARADSTPASNASGASGGRIDIEPIASPFGKILKR
ncbi:MAG: PilT/PilU family type 4a pilus ATPase [Verrucomicrobiota bacterium]